MEPKKDPALSPKGGSLAGVEEGITLSEEFRVPIEAGKRIGQYLLERKLDNGGSGEVWLARYGEWEDRLLAIKFIRPDRPADSKLRHRFAQEANTLIELHHENIVRLHLPQFVGNVPYLVMEYLAGMSLQRILRARGGGLNPEEILWLLSKIAPALHYAHTKGVTHCDIKPANILLDRPVDGPLHESDAIPKLIDFDIATLESSEHNHMRGTPKFMAPEVLQGYTLSFEERKLTDIYGLGATAYSLVTGTPPFSGRTLEEIAFNVCMGVNPLPDSGSGIASLDEAILGAMACEPAERFPDALAFLSSANGLACPSLSDEPATPRSTFLALRLDSDTHPDQNHVLRIGLANPLDRPVHVDLQIESAFPDILSVYDSERTLDIAPDSVFWTSVGFRSREPGQQELKVSMRLRLDGNSLYTFWKVPSGGIHLDFPAQRTLALVIDPTCSVDAAADGHEIWVREFESGTFATPANEKESPRLVQLVPPLHARGVQIPPPELVHPNHIRMDVWQRESLIQRSHLVFVTELQIGRVATPTGPTGQPLAHNHLALCWLPSRSQQLDPENFARNCTISRCAATIALDRKQTVLSSHSGDLSFDSAPLLKGQRQVLHAGRLRSFELGSLPLELQVFRAQRADRELSDVERAPSQPTMSSSGDLHITSHHHALRLRRLTAPLNVDYFAVSSWIRVGGGPEDTCHIQGLPPGLFVLGRHSGVTYILQDSSTSPDGPAQGLWVPLDLDLEMCHEDWRIQFSPASATDCIRDGDLISSTLPPA